MNTLGLARTFSMTLLVALAGCADDGAAAEGWGPSTGSPSEFEVVLDRPYAFFIVDGPTDAVLFNGRFAG